MIAYEIRFMSQRQSLTTCKYKRNTISQNTLTQRSNDDGQRMIAVSAVLMNI